MSLWPPQKTPDKRRNRRARRPRLWRIAIDIALAAAFIALIIIGFLALPQTHYMPK